MVIMESDQTLYCNTTLPETNSELTPENGCLEDYFHFGKAILRVLLVFGRVT